MYVLSTGACFSRGNDIMAEIVRALTPPPAVGLCSDFGSSHSMANLTPFPAPVPAPWPGGGTAGPSGTVPGSSPSSPAGGSSYRPPGSIWTAPGGASTYPWGPLQREVSDMIPAWEWNCGRAAPPAGSPAAAIPPGSSKLLWGALGAVLLLGLVTGERGRRR